MNQLIRNDKGITLIELLAVLAIGSLLLPLIIGVTVNGQKTYVNQTNAAEQLTEIRYAVKVITKEVRKAERITVAENKLTIYHDTHSVIRLKDGKVWQNDTVLADQISTLKFSADDRLLTISIATDEINGEKQENKMDIYLRDGVKIEQ